MVAGAVVTGPTLVPGRAGPLDSRPPEEPLGDPDLDPASQQHALELLRAAVAAGQASPGDLAHLTDRVAADSGRPSYAGYLAEMAEICAEE
jgi:hypothetical protein